MEGGITVFLTLLILIGAGIGAFLLFGSGGYARRKQLEGDLGEDGSGERPRHRRAEDEADVTTNVPSPPTRPNPSE